MGPWVHGGDGGQQGQLNFPNASSANAQLIIGSISDWLNYLKKRRTELGRLSTGVALSYSAIGLYLFLHLAIFIVFNPAIPTIVKTWLPPFHLP